MTWLTYVHVWGVAAPLLPELGLALLQDQRQDPDQGEVFSALVLAGVSALAIDHWGPL
jgi:hypothetical protein